MDITNDLGAIKLGNTLLPGVYQGCEIQGKVKLDDVDVPGQSGSSPQPLGFEDAIITINLLLLNDDNSSPYDKAKTIIRLFRAQDQNAIPFVYRLVNPMANLCWGIKQVLFVDLTTSDTNQRDTLIAKIKLREYRPIMVKKEMAVNTKKIDTTPAEEKPPTLTAPYTVWSMTPTLDKLEEYRRQKLYPGLDNDQPTIGPKKNV